MSHKCLATSLTILLFLTPGYAQRSHEANRGVATTIESRTLRVRIALAQGSPLQSAVMVLLQADVGTTIAQVTTSNGTATFSDLGVGRYRIQVSGPGIEDYTSAPFSIGSVESFHEEFVMVRPSAPGGDTARPGGTVASSDLGVPQKARDAYNKGNEALVHKDYKKAVKEFQKAIEDYPKYGSAHGGLGLALLRSGDRNAARTEFLRSTELDDKQEPAFVNLGKISLEDHAYADSEKFLAQAVALNPTDPEALSYLADAEFFLGKYEDVIASVHKLHQQNPQHSYGAVHFLAANALERLHRPDEAAQEYKAFLAEDPTNRRAPLAKEALARLGK